MNLQNLRLLRQANGLSLSEMAELLTANGYPITKGTLSNYEIGKFLPQDDFYSIVSKELNVPISFFKDDTDYSSDIVFFSEISMADRRLQELNSFIAIEVGRSYLLDRKLGIENRWSYSEPAMIAEADVEAYVADLRKTWGLGDCPISSVCGLLERKGWYLFSAPESFTERNLCGYIRNLGIPFALFQPDVFQDELRINLLKSLGRSLIKGKTQELTEKLIARFSRAMLAPSELIRYEFGEKRTSISEIELSTVKQSLGLGKRYIMKRLRELGIVSNTVYSDYINYLSQRRYLTGIGGLIDNSTFFDIPTSYEMRVARAKSEGIDLSGS